MPPRRRYPTDLTDAQWAILEPLVPRLSPAGVPPRTPAARSSTHAYVLRGGHQLALAAP